jgi:hypothetical protein
MTMNARFALAVALLLGACSSTSPGQAGNSGSGGSGTGGAGALGGRGGTTGGTSSTSGSGGSGGSGGTGGTGGSGGATGGTGGTASPIDAPVVEATPDDVASTIDGPVADVVSSGDAGDSAPQMILPPAAPGSPEPIGAGWTEVFPSYKMDQPPGQVRYTLENGEFHLWLFNNDASTYPGRDSGPRSELHIRNNYSTGQAQYQADIKIDNNCSGVSLMQVFGGSRTATGFMAFVSGDSLTHYASETIVSSIRNRWFRLNVVHDTATANVDVYIDGQRRGRYQDHGPATHYFKCGLYHQRNMTARCDAWFKNIRVFKK